MNDSLSIVVPVRNVETTLPRQIARLLDLLPDLSGRFEIVVVDDASTDHTVELVRDLSAQYPQLRLIRHREVRGREAAVRTGLQWAQGGTVFVQEDSASLSPADLRRLWSLRHDAELVVARAQPRPGIFDEQLLERLSQWGQTLRSLARDSGGPESPVAGGIQMIRRAAVEKLLADDRGDEELAVAHLPAATESRADPSHRSPSPRQPKTFLRHLKNLALGE